MQTTQEKLIHATIDLSNQLGLAGAATAKIAKQAKVANGTLFHHFPNKQKLIEAAYIAIQKDYAWNVVGIFDYPEKDLEKRLKKAIKSSIDYWIRHAPSFEFTRQVVSSRFFSADLREQSEHVNFHLQNALDLGIRKKILTKMEVSMMNHLIFTTVLNVARLVLNCSDLVQQRKVRKSGSIFIWNAIATFGPK